MNTMNRRISVTSSPDDVNFAINSILNSVEYSHSIFYKKSDPQQSPTLLALASGAVDDIDNKKEAGISSAFASNNVSDAASGTKRATAILASHDCPNLDETSRNRSTSSSTSSVNFDKVTIRTYNVAAVVNLSSSSFGQSWESCDPQQDIEMPIEAYESSRDVYRRSVNQMLLLRDIRSNLLDHQECDVTTTNIFLRHNLDEVDRAQRQRERMLSQPRRKRREMVDRIVSKTANRGFQKRTEIAQR